MSPESTQLPLGGIPESSEEKNLYNCPPSCAAYRRMDKLLKHITFDLGERESGSTTENAEETSLEDNNGDQAAVETNTHVDSSEAAENLSASNVGEVIAAGKLRQVVGAIFLNLAKAIKTGLVAGDPWLGKLQPEELVRMAFAATCDFAFNLEYLRRIASDRWMYCDATNPPRQYYNYLGVCPYCSMHSTTPTAGRAFRSPVAGVSSSSRDASGAIRRYFGNKVGGHYIGDIGERITAVLLNLLFLATQPDAKIGMVTDRQHPVDMVIFTPEFAILGQIKASPLILYPVLHFLDGPLTTTPKDSDVLVAMRRHFFGTTVSLQSSDLYLYIPHRDPNREKILTLGQHTTPEWGYDAVLDQISPEFVTDVISLWYERFLAFSVPKVKRHGDEIWKAFLTTGWGAPIDDNKTKAGLGRSDNMMKGTYAVLKYGAYYVEPCQQQTLQTALISNLDPAHMYRDYLEKLQDIKWTRPEYADLLAAENIYRVSADQLYNLFDSVLTFNRVIVNNPSQKHLFDFAEFHRALVNEKLDASLLAWSGS